MKVPGCMPKERLSSRRKASKPGESWARILREQGRLERFSCQERDCEPTSTHSLLTCASICIDLHSGTMQKSSWLKQRLQARSLHLSVVPFVTIKDRSITRAESVRAGSNRPSYGVSNILAVPISSFRAFKSASSSALHRLPVESADRNRPRYYWRSGNVIEKIVRWLPGVRI